MAGTTTIYYSPSLGMCLRVFEPRLNKAIISIECLEIVFLVLISILWLRAQKRTPYQFEVLKWYNFGPAMLFWLVYVLLIFIQFFLTECSLDYALYKAYRMTIASQVFQWIALNLTLATTLFAIPSGLDRLREPDSAARRRSSTWTLAARVQAALVAILTIGYLGLCIWAYQSAQDSWNDLSWLLSDDMEPSAFPQYKYVNVALTTCWFAVLLAATARIALGFRAAARCWSDVPASLKGWVVTLCGSMVAYGFWVTFYSFYDTFAEYYIETYLARNVSEMTLTTFFLLLTLLAIVQVSKGASSSLAHPDLYGFGSKECATEGDVEQ